MSFLTPVAGGLWNNRVDVSGAAPMAERQRMSNFNAVTPGWFTTLGTPILAGRDINEGDRKNAPPVIIVNQAFAKKFLNGANPLGHTVVLGEGGSNRSAPKEIVGLVADAVYYRLREPMPPTMYVPVAQFDDSVQPAPLRRIEVRSASGSPALRAQRRRRRQRRQRDLRSPTVSCPIRSTRR